MTDLELTHLREEVELTRDDAESEALKAEMEIAREALAGAEMRFAYAVRAAES